MRSNSLLPLLCAAALVPVAGAIHEPVRLDHGRISGTAGSAPGIRVFKGIPFAAPPVGDLRWRAPRPAAQWDGVRGGEKFAPTCMQTPYPEGSLYRAPAQATSEDCLYLNVWTGAQSAKERRPVMVWIHGGALTRGSGSTPTYDGEQFARKGVVLVTLNYRLGVFGFFAHPELTRESDRNSSGNYGFLDQIAARDWVRKNIASFGGDPHRVTIFGESAGSWSVNLLTATPLAKGLFQRAIGESGANFGPLPKLADAEQAGVKLAQSLGAPSLAALRATSAEDLLKTGGSYRGNVDGWLLPQDVYTIYAQGKQNDVPILIGSNADEGTAFVPAMVTAGAFRDQAQRRFGDKTGDYLKFYPAESDEQARASALASFRDQTFGWEMRTWARLQAKTGRSKVYVYYFNRVPPGPGSARFEAYHASEIAYVFQNLGPNRPWEDADRRLSGVVSSYWVNFAATGDPNGKGLPDWPAYQEKSDLALVLGDKIEPQPVPHKAALDFLDSAYNR